MLTRADFATGPQPISDAMSEHSLPPDPASWPSDPYQLLGVTPGISARDLRKVYLRLIRSYKPEHSPDEFQKIRRAYESALSMAKHFETIRDRDDDVPEPAFRFEPDPDPPKESTRKTAPSIDPWNLACRGEPEATYRALRQAHEIGNSTEEAFLQAYWLLALIPGLDRARLPIDWLIRGLAQCGPGAGRLRELLRRELTSDPDLAMSDRVLVFLRRKSSPALLLDVTVPRWRAARSARRWAVILSDVHSLRNWVPSSDVDIWARLLLAASMNLTWADKPDSAFVSTFCREVEHLGHRQEDYAGELYQVEFACIVKAGLDRLGVRAEIISDLDSLLACSWDENGPEFRRRLRSHIEAIARDVGHGLLVMDQVQAGAPAVLGRVSDLMGGLDIEDYRIRGLRSQADLAQIIGRFLSDQGRKEYRVLRFALLRFCLQEAMSPGLVARTLANQPEFVLAGKNPLAQDITDDWPLRHVYRAVELSREEPAESAFGG